VHRPRREAFVALLPWRRPDERRPRARVPGPAALPARIHRRAARAPADPLDRREGSQKRSRRICCASRTRLACSTCSPVTARWFPPIRPVRYGAPRRPS